MQSLIESVSQISNTCTELPFAMYTSIKEQHIVNVPINKPLLICVLDGCKKLGQQGEIVCPSGEFIFLSNSPNVEMRNIPAESTYFALLIEFDYEDFLPFTQKTFTPINHFQGEMSTVFKNSLQQFVDWSSYSPQTLWPLRRQELLQILAHEGYQQLGAILEPPSLSYRVTQLISDDVKHDIQASDIAAQLSMSESTLRRKLSAENTHLQHIKDQVRLSTGLHLIQTSLDPIGLIAEQCGYQSQSRFTDKFKRMFGITPSALRKTRVSESGE